jgi:hypothetical protein
MICQHRSIKQPHTGQTDFCSLCKIAIIFDGRKWTWFYGLDKVKRDKLTRSFLIDQITGAH